MVKTLKPARRFSALVAVVEVTDGVRYVGTLRKCNAGTIAKPITAYEFTPTHGPAFTGENHESAASLLRKVARNMAMFPDVYADTCECCYTRHVAGACPLFPAKA